MVPGFPGREGSWRGAKTSTCHTNSCFAPSLSDDMFSFRSALSFVLLVSLVPLVSLAVNYRMHCSAKCCDAVNYHMHSSAKCLWYCKLSLCRAMHTIIYSRFTQQCTPPDLLSSLIAKMMRIYVVLVVALVLGTCHTNSCFIGWHVLVANRMTGSLCAILKAGPVPVCRLKT